RRGQVIAIIVDYRRIEEVAAAVLDQDVVSHFRGRATLAQSYCGHGVAFLRQVVRWIAEAEHLRKGKAFDQREGGSGDRVLGENSRPHRRVLHRPYTLREPFRRDRLIGRRAGEGVLAALEPKQDADGPRWEHWAD